MYGEKKKSPTTPFSPTPPPNTYICIKALANICTNQMRQIVRLYYLCFQVEKTNTKNVSSGKIPNLKQLFSVLEAFPQNSHSYYFKCNLITAIFFKFYLNEGNSFTNQYNFPRVRQIIK